eukprot:g9056.t1
MNINPAPAPAPTPAQAVCRAMPPKKKTATTEAEPSESAPANATDSELAPATAPSTATEAKADEKTEAKSPLASFGKKKSKSQKKPQELDKKVYVVFKEGRNNPDAIYDEAKEGRLEATWMVTAGEDEVPYVACEEGDVIRVFRSFKALKGFYVKGLVPLYAKFGIVNPTAESK